MRFKVLALAIVLTVMSTACGDDGTKPIQVAAEACEVGLNVQDEGTSVSFDTEGEEDLSGDAIEDVVCVLIGLEVPDRVIEHMSSTRALDGTQSASWDNYEAFWTYHPDAGMNLTVYEVD